MTQPSHRTTGAVIFDMGGVFVLPHPEAMLLALKEAAIEVGNNVVVDSDAIHRAHYLGVRGITDLLAQGEISDMDQATWERYDRAYFAALGVAELDLDEITAVRSRQRRERLGGIWCFLLNANIAAFARIAAAYPVAIVTNNDGSAVEQCLEFGICGLAPGPLPTAAAIVDSAVVGIVKPDPAIFTPALEALGVPAEQVLYVGDTVHADVIGATRAGLTPVQLDPLDLHADHDHWRVPDVTALADQLGA